LHDFLDLPAMGPTNEEIERVKEQFTIVDQDGSGLIEKEELEVLLSILGMDPDAENLDSLFEVLDTDKDGFINFEEFVDFIFSTGDKEFLTEADLEKVRQISERRKEFSGKDSKEKDESDKSKEKPDTLLNNSEASNQDLEFFRQRVDDLEEQLRQRDQVVMDLMSQLKKAEIESQSSKDVCECQSLKEEIVQLKDQLHEKRFSLQRLENQQEKTIEGYVTFVKALLQSSATERLEKYCDLSTAEMLGKGAYGFVMTCQDKEHREQLVVKLQGPRWASVAAQEWAHGASCKHENIVAHLEVLMHHDSEGCLESKILDAFEDGTFGGRKPKIFPDRYICMVMEHMNRGTVQHLAEQKLIDLEGLAAVVRQVASALAFMHKSKRTHNDVKPENILLKQVSGSAGLIVKLGDLGLAQCSVDRERDLELAAYTFWCIGLGEAFEHVPAVPDRQSCAQRFTSHALPQDPRKDLRIAIGQVIEDLWSFSASMASVAVMEEFQDAQLVVVEPTKHEEIEVNAKQELSKRMERTTALLWKAVHMVGTLKKWSEEVEYQGWH